MRLRLPSLLAGLVLLVPGVAHADGHKVDLFGGYDYGDGGSRLHGFRQALAWVPRDTEGWLTIIAPDVGVRFGTTLTQVATLFGGRVTLPMHSRGKAFAHALVGSVSTNDGTGAGYKTNSAYGFGVGTEFYFSSRSTSAPPYSGVGIRAQVDHVAQNGDGKSFTRVAVGFVYRIARH